MAYTHTMDEALDKFRLVQGRLDLLDLAALTVVLSALPIARNDRRRVRS